MLAQHVVDIDVGADRRVLLQMPDLDDGITGHVEHQPQLAGADGHYEVPNGRVFCDAALEFRCAGATLFDFSDQIESRGRMAAVFLRERTRLHRHVSDDAN